MNLSESWTIRSLMHLGLRLTALAGSLAAQCDPEWLAGTGVPGTDGEVAALVSWDADGTGPASPLVVFAGEFSMVGAMSLPNVAAWDPATGNFVPLGGGLANRVWALASSPAGELYAATTPFSSATTTVWRWSGSTWQPLGGTFPAPIFTLSVLADGTLLAGGQFQSVGGVAGAGLARWNGAAWVPFGSGVLNGTISGSVSSIFQAANGDLLVGGAFTHIDGTAANCIARWSGSVWSPLGSGILPVVSDHVRAITEMPNGDIVAGGFFANAGGLLVSNIARWNGSAWSAIGTGVSTAPPWTTTVFALSVLPNGHLLVGGAFGYASGILTLGIARWSGSTWAPLGPGFQPLGIAENARVNALLQLPGGHLLAAGNFVSGGGQLGDRLSRWNGTSWSTLVGGLNGAVIGLDVGPDGTVWIGGRFTVAGLAAANRVARLGPSGWLPLGSGTNGQVNRVVAQANGGVIVGGSFTHAGGVLVSNIARWNGSTWSALASGLNGAVRAMVEMPNGDLVVAGSFTAAGAVGVMRIARWNGISWSPLGSGIGNGVLDLLAEPSGSLLACGNFNQAGGTSAQGLARWNGVAWTGIPGIYIGNSLSGTRSGQFLVASDFSVLRWNGSLMAPVGTPFDGIVRHVLELPGGDVVAAGDFSSNNGMPTTRIAFWNGAQWTALGAGTEHKVQVLQLDRAGGLWVGGEFLRANGQINAYAGRIGSTCPSVVTSVGVGCPGGAGGVLHAQSGAWLGDSFAARGSGWSAATLVIGVTGFSLSTLSLPAVLPLAGAGCELLVAADLLGFAVATGGVTLTTLAIPNNSSLIGASLHHQQIPCALDAGGAIVEARATNALSVTIGDY